MTSDHKRSLSRIQRIARTSDFGRVYAVGRSGRGKYLVFWSCGREDADGPARLGVVCSKRALSKAHERNRAKRLLREAFRNNKELFEDGVDYVLIARRAIRDAADLDVVADMKKAAGRQR